jgi:hypothetical protein
MFAASVLLFYITRVRAPPQSSSTVRSIDMAVEILNAMDESVVAKKSAEIIKQSLKEAIESGVDSLNMTVPHAIPIGSSQIFGPDFSDLVCNPPASVFHLLIKSVRPRLFLPDLTFRITRCKI